MTPIPSRARHLLPVVLALSVPLAACQGSRDDPGATATPHGEQADLVLLAGTVHTGIDGAAPARAVAVRDGRILAVGGIGDVRRHQGPGTRIEDLGDHVILPGLTDAHMHLAGVGERALKLNLQGLDSRGAFLARVREQVEKTPDGAWIVGRGWIETHWQPPEFPHRAELDRIAPDNPVFLVRADGHAAVANSAALEAAGIDASTPDPAGGRINRDPDGRATGMLIDAAMSRLREVIPADETPLAEYLRAGISASQRRGWTGVHVAGNDFRTVDALRELHAAGELGLRIYNAVDAPGPAADRLLAEGAITGAGGRLVVRAIKVYADGALGSRGAALLEPYADADTTGLLMVDEDTFLDVYTRALRAGIQVWTHAIGDRANRTVLDLYERAFAQVPPGERGVAEPRWRIEHAQIIHPDDMPRFAGLGVIPSMQPSHAIGDLHFAPARLGLDRLDRAYAWNSLLDSGAIIPAGSDAPVEAGDPFVEFYAAITRRDLEGYSGPGWHPEEAVTRGQALKMLTVWPAMASFREDDLGTIEPGKLADLTVIDRDIMRAPVADIPGTRVVMTLVGGEVVYRARARGD